MRVEIHYKCICSVPFKRLQRVKLTVSNKENKKLLCNSDSDGADCF